MTAPVPELPTEVRRELGSRGARFVLWKWLHRNGRATKVPLRLDGRLASVVEPADWATLDECEAALRSGAAGAAGLGFVLAAELDTAAGKPAVVGVDFDACREPGTGAIESRCGRMIGNLRSYAEVSPSDTGAKAFFLADPAPALTTHKRVLAPAVNGHDKALAVEVYSTGRFFTLTGHHLEITPDELTDATEAGERLVAWIGKRPTRKAADLPAAFLALLDRDAKLRAAWEKGTKLGQGRDTSGSGLDAGLAAYLARHLGDDDLAAVLRVHPHGQLGKGTLKGPAAERRLGRLLDLAAEARAETAAEEADPSGDLSEDSLALDLGRAWGGKARHVAAWGRWLLWSGHVWLADDRLEHMTGTRAFLRRRADRLTRDAEAGKIPGLEPEKAKGIAKVLRSARTVANVASLARSNPGTASGVADWDADPWVLNTPGGLVDLRTGRLSPPDPAALCSKSTSVAPAAPGTPAPMWAAFLERIFRHDEELIPYARRLLGYGLAGVTVEHVLSFAWGQGGNGKGVLFNTVSRLMGDYAAVAPADLLLVTHSDRHPCDMAMLRGARLVTAQELAPGRAWDEPKLKSLTGGDAITARFVRQDFFTYAPQFLLVAAGNHKPSFKGVDEAIRRRVQLWPFLQNIPTDEQDRHLAVKLAAEGPAILRWLIDGCLEWQRVGLAPPKTVLDASESYFAGEDTLGQWIAERCIVRPGIAFTGSTALYTDWRVWCERAGMAPGSGKAFSTALEERGFKSHRTMNGRGFVGIAPRDPEQRDMGL